MKVYICLMGIPYEGYGEPEAVFKQEDDAIAFCKDKEGDNDHTYWDWYEREVE